MDIESKGPDGHLESSMTLLARAKAGDQEALHALYQRYYPRLRRWATGRLSPRARSLLETGDIVNEVLTAFLSQMQNFTPQHPGSIPGYLRMSIYSKIVDADRKGRRRPAREPLGPEGSYSEEEDTIPSTDASPLDNCVARDTLERYEAGLRRLKPEERDAIILKVELAYDWAQIADELAKPSPDAARMFVNRALVKLAREMQRA